MKLFELFSSYEGGIKETPARTGNGYTPTKSHTYSTKINGKLLDLVFDQYDAHKAKGGSWDVGLMAVDRADPYDLTHDHKAIKVFSFVKTAMESFIEKFEPETITFDGQVSTGLAKFYEKFLTKYKPRGYDLKIDKMKHDYGFTLIKK
jgi:hypothetical protein